jgi:hypothetical protein
VSVRPRFPILVILLLAACGGGDDAATDTSLAGSGPTTPATDVAETTTSQVASTGAPAGEGCADVVDVEITLTGETASFAVTVLSADTGWDKYADAWEVRTADGVVLGVRELLHPHENEQPFTRSLAGVEVPADVTEVEIAARDSVLGFCGETMIVPVPSRS